MTHRWASICRSAAGVSSPLAAAALMAGALAPLPARAVLGEAVASVQADQIRLAGRHSQSVSLGYEIHEITMTDGSRIREFVSPSGIVFAVAWNTRFKPDLAALLGRYHADYTAAAHDAMKRPGIRRDVTLRHGDIVVHSMGHLNAFVGTAYVASMMPSGTTANVVR